jgi:ATP-dependent 26S proteasome regulatory subunit
MTTPTLIDYLRAGYPGISLTTHEETRAYQEIESAATTLERPILHWSITNGLIDPSKGTAQACDELDVLGAIDSAAPGTILVLFDYHLHLTGEPPPQLVRALKEALIAAKQATIPKAILFVGCRAKFPAEIEKLIVNIDLTLPDRATLTQVVTDVLLSNDLPAPDTATLDTAVTALSGLTTTEAENAVSLSLITKGTLDPATLYHEKATAVKKTGLMELHQPAHSLNDIGGMDGIKDYLHARRRDFSAAARAYGIKTPRGLLMAGLPGTGKTEICKGISAFLQLPLIRVVTASIMDSLVGGSEANFRLVRETAERIAPCILWFDEIEKAFAGIESSGKTDGGTLKRVFGELLTMMSESTNGVLIVASANDVSDLDPALMRRFDENFWVDLPSLKDRTEIWTIMGRRYGHNADLTPADYAAFAAATNQWTGSEINQAFNNSIRLAFLADRPNLIPEDILTTIATITPMSRTQPDKIKALRDWSQGRCRPASTDATADAPPTATTTGRKLQITPSKAA